MTDLNPYEEGLALELQEAKGQIKALQKALKDQSSVSDRLAEQLATCEKYRDAYAECDRIGTQAVRDLEDKLALMVFERDEVIMFERDEAWKRAAHSEKMWGEAEAKLAENEVRLRKAVEALENLADCVDLGCFCSEMQMASAMDIARTTLAEIKGESHA
jgi:hypothetical protein